MSLSGATLMDRPNFILDDKSYSDDEVMEFMREDPSYYNRVEEPIVLRILDKFPFYIEYMTRPPKHICERVIASSPRCISYLAKPTKEIQLLAVSLDTGALKYINKPCSEVKSLASLLA